MKLLLGLVKRAEIVQTQSRFAVEEWEKSVPRMQRRLYCIAVFLLGSFFPVAILVHIYEIGSSIVAIATVAAAGVDVITLIALIYSVGVGGKNVA